MLKIRARERALFIEPGFRDWPQTEGYDRIYFGSEFCEKLLPTVETEEAIMSDRPRGRPQFTLVTPYLTDAGMKNLAVLLECLARKGPESLEIVFNDWGTLNLMACEYGGRFQAVLGRLLTTQRIWARRGPPDAFMDFMRARGIFKMEFNSYQHWEFSRPKLVEQKMQGHLYWPYAYLATSRFCLLAG